MKQKNTENFMDSKNYHDDTSRISKSGLDLMNRSPAHYYARYLDPNRLPQPYKQHFVIGSITHSCILEPDKLEKEFFVLKDADIVKRIGGGNPRSTNEYKAWKAEQMAIAAGRQHVTQEEFDSVRRMRDAVFAHPAASVLLSDGTPEYFATWEDPDTGAPCKLKTDWLSATGFITDLKTTDDARPDGFGRSAWNYRYHVQGAFYTDGMNANFPDSPARGFVFIAVEKEAPHAVQVYAMDDDAFELGRDAYKRNLEMYMSCRIQGEWPAYPTEITRLRFPTYAYKKL
ncbi:MAG: PD-(D/E)XK nuclease-like domain-containing protein [Flavobacteriales bacterium]